MSDDLRVLEVQIKHEREMREELGRLLERALVLQAKEYERRLDALNHEYERILAAEARSVSSERYDANRKADRELMAAMNLRLNAQKEELIRLATLIAVAVSLAGYLLR